jgi:hypothetical protein
MEKLKGQKPVFLFVGRRNKKQVICAISTLPAKMKTGKRVLFLTVAQFFKQKSSRASQQVCWPGAEQADKFMF